jgi:hypothetical protein
MSAARETTVIESGRSVEAKISLVQGLRNALDAGAVRGGVRRSRFFGQRRAGKNRSEGVKLKTAIMFVLATIGFYLAIETAWFTYAAYSNYADREGGVGMAVLFVFGPISALILGAGTTYLLGGKAAPHRVKVAAGLVGLIILAAMIGTVFGL